MSAVKGRRKRATTREPVVTLQARLPVEVRDAARDAADGLGLSLAAYVEALIVGDHREHYLSRDEEQYRQEVLTA